MKTLFNSINEEYQKRMSDFVNSINETENFDTWYYNELMPKGNKKQFSSTEEKRDYLKARKQAKLSKDLSKEIAKVETILNSEVPELITVSIEWKKNKTWGSNPSATAKASYKNGTCQYFESGSISGCGYDKESTAFANSVNQINGLLRSMYEMKQNSEEENNHKLFGYGSGYGLLPYFEGGVGVSCYYGIFEKIGFKLEKTASGKTFDVWTISKM